MAIIAEVSLPPMEAGNGTKIERKPRPLARNVDKQIEQIGRIANKPTPAQSEQITQKLKADGVEGELANHGSEYVFKNATNLLGQRKQAENDVRRARSAALSSPDSAALQVNKAALSAAKNQLKQTEAEIRDLGDFLKEAGIEEDPSQAPLNLGEKAQVGMQKIGAGLTLGAEATGSAIKDVVKTTEEAGKNIVTGSLGLAGSAAESVGKAARATGETGLGVVKGGAEFVGSGVKLGGEAVSSGFELGRRGIQSAVEVGVSSLQTAKSTGEASWKAVLSTPGKLVSGASDVGGKASGRLGGFFGGLGRGLVNKAEVVTKPVGETLNAAGAFSGKIAAEVAKDASATASGAGSLIDKARLGAPKLLSGFASDMKAAGEGALKATGEAGKPVVNFIQEQGKRIAETEQKVAERIAGEVKKTLENGKGLIEPGLKSIQKDREKLRDKENLLHEKLNIIVESISDAASPVIDSILDQGRDIRDAAAGVSKKGVHGAQIFARGISHNVGGFISKEASPILHIVGERAEDLRLRSNDARTRVNQLLDGTLETTGRRFKSLTESASARAQRMNLHLSDIKADGEKIVKNGVEVSVDIARKFVQKGAVAKEFLQQRKEQAGEAVQAMRNYWEVDAVEKWKEMGFSVPDIKLRQKLQRANFAASMKSAVEAGKKVRDTAGKVGEKALEVGSMGAAFALEHEKEIVIAALFYVGATHGQEILLALQGVEDMISHISSDPSHLFQGGASAVSGAEHVVNVPQMGQNISDLQNAASVDVSSLGSSGVSGGGEIHQVMGVDTSSNLPSVGTINQATSVDLSGHVGTSLGGDQLQPAAVDNGNLPATEAGTAGSVASSDVATPVSTGEPTVGNEAAGFTPAGSEMVNAIPVPENILKMIEHGKPVVEQLNNLMPNATDQERLQMLQRILDLDFDNFKTTAEAIVNGTGSYSDDQITIARDQLTNLTEIKNNPGLLNSMDGQEALAKIAKALHFWRPGA